MKYIILNDLEYIFKEKYKLIELYMFVFILYFFLIRSTFIYEDVAVHYLNQIFGFQVNIKDMWMDATTQINIIINFSIYFYIAAIIILKDLDNLDNLFTRISFSKWINTKVITQFIICVLIQTIIFLPAYFCNNLTLSFYLVIIKRSLIITILVIYLYLLIITYNKNKAIFMVLLLLMLSVITHRNWDIREIGIYNILIALVIEWIINLIIYKNLKFCDLKG